MKFFNIILKYFYKHLFLFVLRTFCLTFFVLTVIFDTVELSSTCFVTIVLDGGSRKIMTYQVTASEPTANDLIRMFKYFFTEKF